MTIVEVFTSGRSRRWGRRRPPGRTTAAALVVRRAGRTLAVASVLTVASAMAGALTAPAPAAAAPRAAGDRAGAAGGGVEADRSSEWPSISGDGRHVAYTSFASNLVPGDDDGGRADAFVHHLRRHRTEQLTLPGSRLGGARTEHTAISRDGRFVLLDVYPDDPGQPYEEPFVWDSRRCRFERIAVDDAGRPGNDVSMARSISADGRYVAFDSAATNLVPGQLFDYQPYVRDRWRGTTDAVAVSTAGVPADHLSNWSSISDDGRWVAFGSMATNLTAEPHRAGFSDVYLRDRWRRTTVLVSRTPTGQRAAGTSQHPVLSGNGRYVAFLSDASDLVPGDTNKAEDLFVRNLRRGLTRRVTVDDPAGRQVLGPVTWYRISATGRYVVFADRVRSLDPSIPGSSGSPGISDDGRMVVFTSGATNLVPGDTNGVSDIFVHDRQRHTTRRISVPAPAGSRRDAYFFTRLHPVRDGYLPAVERRRRRMTVA